MSAEESPSRYTLGAVEALFNGALDRPPGQVRLKWVERAAGGDEKLVEQVLQLLSAHETSGDFLEQGALLPHDGELDSDAAAPGAAIGTEIGPYRLVAELGEGGFGTVYRAEQSEPVRREVALKIIKLGMDTRQVIARFEAERQALALMDHPSIARVLDAGSTESGRPYFVMDLAPGVALTKFCDERRLSIRDRLQLFVHLCSAVQHAHQRGVIHRDLKPSNVLVAETEGSIVPKVIDFGIAKATGEELTDATLFTAQGQVIGTPIYMSPEQATGRSDIDTRSDVYSLGVMLFELVTGTTPMRVEEIRERASAGELGAYVRDFEPPLPSTRVTRGVEGVDRAARARGGTVTEIRREVRGDLDHVIQCALANDRDRRYESAAALARDVQRVLEDRPIEATPPSTAYRASKFLRRHRVLAAALTAVLAALLAGGAIAVDSMRAKRKQAVLLSGVLTRATDVQREEGARGLMRDATDAFGPDDPILIDALATLAARQTLAGNLDGAVESRRMAVEVAERIHGAETRPAARERAAFGIQLLRSGDRRGAEEALDAALELDRSLLGNRTPALNEARLELAGIRASNGDVRAAEALAEEAVAVAETSAPADLSLRTAALERLVTIRRRGEDDASTEEAWRALVASYAATYPESSTFLARQRVEYGTWLASVGLAEGAARQLRVALESLDALEDPPADLVVETLASLNRVLSQQPALASDEAARRLLDRELDAARRRFDPSASEYLDALGRCAADFARRGDLARSTEVLVERFQAFADAADGSERAQRAQLVLADELAERADLIRRQDGLDPATYAAARAAVELASTVKPDDQSIMISKVMLAVRDNDFFSFFAALQELEAASEFEGENPLFLAAEAVAFYQTQATKALARSKLERARALSREPQFAGYPGLQETLRWASRVIEGGRTD